jgi:hypothetical protein
VIDSRLVVLKMYFTLSDRNAMPRLAARA